MNEETVRNWLFLAMGDLKTAEDELKSEEPFTNTICFHSQQFVEKVIKAFLTLVDIPFGKTHDIAELIELARKKEPTFEELYKFNAYKLTRYAVEVRYPDEFYIPTLEEAKESIQIAKNVRKFSRKIFQKYGIKYKY